MIEKYKCAKCGRTIMIGEIVAGNFTIKCKKCGAVNLIQVHPCVIIREIPPAIMVQGKIMSVSLPVSKQVVRLVETK